MKKLLVLILLGSFFQTTYAAVTQTYSGSISAVRVEGTSGLITLSSPLLNIAGNSTGCTRVWADLNSNAGRAAYSTALMAITTKNPKVGIRGSDVVANKRYGACMLYDIYVPQN